MTDQVDVAAESRLLTPVSLSNAGRPDDPSELKIWTLWRGQCTRPDSVRLYQRASETQTKDAPLSHTPGSAQLRNNSRLD
jgi:hypothetical protein